MYIENHTTNDISFMIMDIDHYAATPDNNRNIKTRMLHINKRMIMAIDPQEFGPDTKL